METSHPYGRLGGDIRRHGRLLFDWDHFSGGSRPKHSYQPSIQFVICSVALAMCFSTVLMLSWRWRAMAW